MTFTLRQKTIFAARARNLELLKERVGTGGDLKYQDPEGLDC